MRNKSAVETMLLFAVSRIPLRVRIVYQQRHRQRGDAPVRLRRLVRIVILIGLPQHIQPSPRNEGPNVPASRSVNHHPWRRPFIGDCFRTQGVRGRKAELFPDDEQSPSCKRQDIPPIADRHPTANSITDILSLGPCVIRAEHPRARLRIFEDRKDRGEDFEEGTVQLVGLQHEPLRPLLRKQHAD